MIIRDFRIGDEMALHAVFYCAVRQTASRDYSREQIEAWAPDVFDHEAWTQRMRGIRPFVVEDAGEIVAYADVQPDGYIDHFFVSGSRARQGIGSMLMQRIHEAARAQAIGELTSHVSRTAQPLFERFGFVVVEYRSPVTRGVVVPNALMKKTLLPREAPQEGPCASSA
jgi:putative acetyltransferase